MRKLGVWMAWGLVLLFIEISTVFAQNGKLTGRVFDKETKEAIPYAGVKVLSGGSIKGGGISDFDGKFSVAPITPGTYTIEVSGVGYNKYVIEKFTIGFEETKKIDFALTSSSTTTAAVEIVAYKEPLIGVDNGEKVSLSAEQIAKIPTRNVNSMIATQANVYSADDGGNVNIKGMRSSDNAVFINGIRQFGTSLPPAEAISELSIVSGGVPAQYGDALGGIISITTKTAAQKFSFGVQGETSSPFDKWHYNFVGINGSGPIYRKKETLSDGTVTDGRTIVGFFGAVQYTTNADADPSALPIYRATDASLDQLRRSPQVRIPGSRAYTSASNFYTKDNFERVSARPNLGDRSVQSNFNLDIQPNENMMITIGGNFNFSKTRTGPNEDNGANNPNPNSYQNLFNFENNGTRDDQDYNGFIRFRQTFNTGISDTGSLLKNVYYQIQADYTRRSVSNYDPRFMDRQNEYNYVGKFGIKTRNREVPFGTPAEFSRYPFKSIDATGNLISGDSTILPTRDALLFLMNEPAQLTFEPSNLNPELAAINTQIFNDNFVQNSIQLNNFNGFLNGPTSAGIVDNGYFYPALGKAQTSFSKRMDEQYRLSFQAAAEIKNHTIKIGAEFEQRIIRNYSAGSSLYGRARQQLNGHLSRGNNGDNLLVDSSFVSDKGDPNYGKTVIKVFRTPFVDPKTDGTGKHQGQSEFDFRFRQRNGIPINEDILLDSYAPNSFSLNDFTVGNIVDNGNQPLADWQGYTAYGQRTGRTSFYDFFKDTINRPIDAFRPLYYAGFIEDKFEIGDLILRLGLRVDAFDVNMPVLKDKYTFTKLTSAKDFYNNAGRQKPQSVGDDWAVYVDKPAKDFDGSNYKQFNVLGYRNGDVWYDANGFETSNPATLQSSSGLVNPFYDNFTVKEEYQKDLQRTSGITLDAFEDFKPQINVMPRISFSFPISEEALFYAHYDVMTQRPLGVNPGLQQNYATAFDYLQSARRNGGFINNPNLKPQKKIDYAIGFQQALNARSSIKLSTFYSEIKDLIQEINVNFAYPNRYTTNGNQDFSVVKGLSLQYDLRKSDNFTASASYTLSFAEGSASNFAGALLNTATPNLKNITPLNFDQRHALKLNFDYRYGDNEGPELFGVKPLENVGLNATFYTGSGTPFTQDGSEWGGKYQVKGSINGSRLPWNNRTSVRVDKSFILQAPGKRAHNINVYFYVQNLFNAENILSVYARTASATDDGYLVSNFGQNQINSDNVVSASSYAMFYNMAIMNPDNISLPRRFRLGVSYNF